MHGYVDPFAHRSPSGTGSENDDLDAPSDGATPDVDDVDLDEHEAGEVESIGLDGIVDDAARGRREAPFAEDPAHRVRPASQ